MNNIPNEMYSDRSILYYDNNKWDALGLLGERIHRSTIRTKYLQLCFKKIGIHITKILDNEIEFLKKYKTDKKRFLAALYYLSEKIDEEELKTILIKATKLSDERTIYEHSRRGYYSNSRKSFWNR